MPRLSAFVSDSDVSKGLWKLKSDTGIVNLFVDHLRPTQTIIES